MKYENNYYGLRYYNTTLERWINRDTIEQRGGLSNYGFVGNNSISRNDKLVHFWGGTMPAGATIEILMRWMAK
jgi:hypothetical protein